MDHSRSNNSQQLQKNMSQQGRAHQPPHRHQDSEAAADDNALSAPPSSFQLPLSSRFEFPFKLHQLLEDAARRGMEHIVSWSPSASAKNHHTAPPPNIKLRSFQRQLNMYGFSTVKDSSSSDFGCYSNPLFQRNKLELCSQMKRRSSKKKNMAVRILVSAGNTAQTTPCCIEDSSSSSLGVAVGDSGGRLAVRSSPSSHVTNPQLFYSERPDTDADHILLQYAIQANVFLETNNKKLNGAGCGRLLQEYPAYLTFSETFHHIPSRQQHSLFDDEKKPEASPAALFGTRAEWGSSSFLPPFPVPSSYPPALYRGGDDGADDVHVVHKRKVVNNPLELPNFDDRRHNVVMMDQEKEGERDIRRTVSGRYNPSFVGGAASYDDSSAREDGASSPDLSAV